MEKQKSKALYKIKLAKTNKMKLFCTSNDDYFMIMDILDTLEDLIENIEFPYNVNKEICHILIEYLDEAMNYDVVGGCSNYGVIIANLAKYFEVQDMIQNIRYNNPDSMINYEICLN